MKYIIVRAGRFLAVIKNAQGVPWYWALDKANATRFDTKADAVEYAKQHKVGECTLKEVTDT